MYLCGTKYDLVEENKKLRKVEYNTVREYSDGRLNAPEIVLSPGGNSYTQGHYSGS